MVNDTGIGLHLWVEETGIGLHDAHGFVERLHSIKCAFAITQDGCEV